MTFLPTFCQNIYLIYLKDELEKLKTESSQLESRLEQKDKEMTRLQKKHLDDLNFLRQEIEEERMKSLEAENKRILDLEEFFKQAQVILNDFTFILSYFCRSPGIGDVQPHEEGGAGEAADDGAPQ